MAGRPKRTFPKETADEVFRLAKLQCKDSEISASLNIPEATLQRHFDAQLKNGRQSGKKMLRAKQMEIAMKGNVTMLIWLGKQYLEQSDKVEAKDDSRQTITVKYNLDKKPKK